MTATPENKACALCRFSTGGVPVMCRLHTRDGAPRLAVPLRAGAGPCGPEGAFWAPSAEAAAMPPATILQFPKAHGRSA